MLYSKVRTSRFKWLILPAMMGETALLADGALTVTSAVEGLAASVLATSFFSTGVDFVVPVILIILLVVFALQQRGTTKIGKLFGPLMLIWFFFIVFLVFYRSSNTLKF